MQTTFLLLTYVVKNAKNTLRIAILLLFPFCSVFSQTYCEMPTGVKITSILSTKLVLVWDATSISGGSKIQVAWAPYPTSNFIFKSFSSGTSGVIDGLKPGTKYSVRVNKICGTGSTSSVLGLGALRTLTKVEELALCGPEQSGDICKALELIETGNRGSNYIDIRFPELPAAALGAYPTHTVTIRHRTLDQTGLPVGAWQSESHPFSEISSPFRLEGLTANTLYQLTVKWETFDAANVLVKSCEVNLNNTPTKGDHYAGPVFTLNLPPNITLDCSTPEPIELVFPNVTGGCTRPRVSFVDQELAPQNCARQLLRTWFALDDCGRSSTVTQTIILVDSQAPVFIDVPANNVTIDCNDNLPTEAPIAIDNCSEVVITSTEQTSPLGGCKATITRTWTATDGCGNTASYVQIINVLESIQDPNDEDEEIPPLPVNCGQPYTPPVISNATPLQSAAVNDNFTISGFPGKIKDDIITIGNGLFSGHAKVRLPFGNKVVYCAFNSVFINTDKQITIGTLTGVPDPNFVMPDTGSINFGGAICVPDPPALANGFNDQGDYILQPPYAGWQPGDISDPQHDPNGFDANGYHIETGTQYNLQGCDQDGLDSLENPCNAGSQGPYYWLQNGISAPTTSEGIAYATELQPNIRALVLEAINILITTNSTNLSNQRNTCQFIRTDLNTQIGTLDRKFFFGEADIFFKEDMNVNFASTPIPLQQNVPDRSAQVVGIESKHIELYYCDKLVYKFKQITQMLNLMKTEPGLDQEVQKVLEAIQHLTKEQVVQFQADPNKLKEWLRTLINAEILEKLLALGIVMALPAEDGIPSYLVQQKVETPPVYYKPGQHFPRIGTMMASANDETTMRILAAKDLDISPDELRFEYQQGFEYVGGIDRAFYLDAIAKARDRQYAPPGDDEGESLLPIRIEKEVGGRTYTILLDQISLTATGGTMNAYFILDVPNSGQKIVFRAENIPFTPGGMSGAGVKLRLQSDVGIRLNNAAKLIIIGSHNNTFVEFDCNGFKQIGVEADVEFCREFLLPLNPTNLEVDPNESKHVKAHFMATMPAWGEFIATITMDRFALAKHPDFKFQILNASLDFSDVSNPANFTGITPNYFSEFGSGSTFSPQWKGFFMESMMVTLPKNLNKGSTPISVEIHKLIIDDRGLTGLISVNTNVLSLSNGNLSGWAYSIDQLSIAVVANKIQGGGFGGKLHIPLFKAITNNTDNISDADCFSYTAKIIATPVGDLYEFAVTPSTVAKKMDILVGTATLEPNSSVQWFVKESAYGSLA